MTREDLLRGSVYKSLETDDEFKARVTKKHYVYGLSAMSGSYLDDVMWTCFGMQRRIVERETKAI